jgi:toxin YhaV
VKLFLAVRQLVSETIPKDPTNPDFRLRGDLSRFRRTKGLGLPGRYRLFWAFNNQAKVIIMLYLNDARSLRQAGGRNDPYALFSTLLRAGQIGPDFDTNYARWREAQRPPK